MITTQVGLGSHKLVYFATDSFPLSRFSIVIWFLNIIITFSTKSQSTVRGKAIQVITS